VRGGTVDTVLEITEERSDQALVRKELERESLILWVGAVPFVVLSLIFYPPFWTYMDENIYVGLANVLRHGTIFPDRTGVQVPYLAWNGKHSVAQYPLGMPLLIALTSFGGWRAIFMINLVFLLVGFAYFARWLRLEGLSQHYAWLYLYHHPKAQERSEGANGPQQAVTSDETHSESPFQARNRPSSLHADKALSVTT
jgi:hypothetical protein